VCWIGKTGWSCGRALIDVISENHSHPEYVGAMLEKTSVRWPAALRRRFLSALHYRTRKRWPYTPYRAAAQLGSPVKRAEIANVYGLRSPATNSRNGSSAI
jgi:hypothetical protein